MIDMGLEPFLVASTLEGLMAQRLVRRVCKKCKEEVKPSDAQRKEGYFPEDITTTWIGRGCEECRMTGYRGRVGIFELVVVDDEIRDMIHSRESSNKIKKHCVEHGMQTLRTDGWGRVREGVTSAEEVIRITKADKF